MKVWSRIELRERQPLPRNDNRTMAGEERRAANLGGWPWMKLEKELLGSSLEREREREKKKKRTELIGFLMDFLNGEINKIKKKKNETNGTANRIKWKDLIEHFLNL